MVVFKICTSSFDTICVVMRQPCWLCLTVCKLESQSAFVALHASGSVRCALLLYRLLWRMPMLALMLRATE
jgi:hypothetical protein